MRLGTLYKGEQVFLGDHNGNRVERGNMKVGTQSSPDIGHQLLILSEYDTVVICGSKTVILGSRWNTILVLCVLTESVKAIKDWLNRSCIYPAISQYRSQELDQTVFCWRLMLKTGDTVIVGMTAERLVRWMLRHWKVAQKIAHEPVCITLTSMVALSLNYT